MRLKPTNILYHELIGLDVTVEDSKNPYQVGIKGKVTDETKKMLMIFEGAKEKKIAKKDAKFMFKNPLSDLCESSIRKLENGTFSNDLWKNVLIDGRLLVGRPEERIKKMGDTS
jgi:RNase P/RNase MRP subunit p29